MDTTSEWVVSPENPGYRMKTIQHGNCTIQILRPELTVTERTKRENFIRGVAEKTLASYYIRKGGIS